jgi:hypothetical protein
MEHPAPPRYIPSNNNVKVKQGSATESMDVCTDSTLLEVPDVQILTCPTFPYPVHL